MSHRLNRLLFQANYGEHIQQHAGISIIMNFTLITQSLIYCRDTALNGNTQLILGLEILAAVVMNSSIF
jgi:hypothetical protein